MRHRDAFQKLLREGKAGLARWAGPARVQRAERINWFARITRNVASLPESMCHRGILPFICLALSAAGCASMPGTPSRITLAPVKRDEFIVQRAILSIHGRQFAMNGYLALNREGGQRLVVTENFGGVLADVLVRPTGQITVERSSQLFRPEWIERYLVPDLECAAGGGAPSGCSCDRPDPQHTTIKHPAYTLDLQTLETRPGPQAPQLFEASQPATP